MKLDGKVAIVTGAAQGTGHAIAERFLRDGARVMIADHDQEAGEAAERDLAPLGAVQFHKTDVGRRLDVHNLVAATLDAFGEIDILVNNAGITHDDAFLDLTEEGFEKVLRTNLKGCFLMGQAVARCLVEKVERGGSPGSIVNISSIHALVTMPNLTAYAVSKAGVNQLTRSMALALAPHGIRVNAVGVGSIEANMPGPAQPDPTVAAGILASTPLGRLGRAEEIAAVAVFLASDEASYVTGQVLHADGGRLPLNFTASPGET